MKVGRSGGVDAWDKSGVTELKFQSIDDGEEGRSSVADPLRGGQRQITRSSGSNPTDG